jgi:hypothetical protein
MGMCFKVRAHPVVFEFFFILERVFSFFIMGFFFKVFPVFILMGMCLKVRALPVIKTMWVKGGRERGVV